MRQDYRTKEQFKQDIKFYTKIEEFWFQVFLSQLKLDKKIKLIYYDDFGVDNTGQYVTKAHGGADYRIYYKLKNQIYMKLIEIKWSPVTKCTFKIDNLKNYIEQDASIAIFYNVGKQDFRKKNYNSLSHIKLLSANLRDFKWGLIHPDCMQKMLQLPVEKPYYMGNKPSVIIPDIEQYINGRYIR